MFRCMMALHVTVLLNEFYIELILYMYVVVVLDRVHLNVEEIVKQKSVNVVIVTLLVVQKHCTAIFSLLF